MEYNIFYDGNFARPTYIQYRYLLKKDTITGIRSYLIQLAIINEMIVKAQSVLFLLASAFQGYLLSNLVFLIQKQFSLVY